MHRSRKPPVKRIWSAWGDWVWSQSGNRYYQQRQDNYGELETRWGPAYEARESTGHDVRVPRRESERDEDLVDRFQNTHLGDEADLDEDQEEPAGYSHERSAAYSTTHGESSSKTKSKSKGKGKSKGKEKEKEQEPYYDSEGDRGYDNRDIGYGSSRRHKGDAYDEVPEEDPYYSARGKSTHSPSQPDPYPASSRHHDQGQEVDSDYAEPVEPIGNDYQLGGSSSAPVDAEYDEPGYSGETQSEMYETSTTLGQTDYISGATSPEDALDLDPRYRIEKSHRFEPGEVFKILWPEPSGGQAARNAPTLSDRRAVPDRYGGTIYVGFRRFIVVANDEGHCTCVPIFTYGGKGCKKKGIKPDKHGIITAKGTKPKRLEGEPKLGFPPVRMNITVHSEQIARESRVNYSKLVSIEHNVKVFFIGSIYDKDYELVADAVNDCWDKKVFHKKNH